VPSKKKTVATKKPAANKKPATKKKTSTSTKPVTTMKPAPKKATGKKPAAKKTTSPSAPARKGDLIVIDSSKVGSPAREGEVLEVIQGQISVSYRVQWPDGHQSLIAPGLGSARVVPASARQRPTLS
jgi:sRNA-binding protein